MSIGIPEKSLKLCQGDPSDWAPHADGIKTRSTVHDVLFFVPCGVNSSVSEEIGANWCLVWRDKKVQAISSTNCCEGVVNRYESDRSQACFTVYQ